MAEGKNENSTSDSDTLKAEIFTCPFCAKKYSWRSDMRKHCVENHEEKMLAESPMFICSICYKKCISKAGLLHHCRSKHNGLGCVIDTDTKVYDYVCTVCGKECLTQHGLIQHCQIFKHDGCKVNTPTNYDYVCSVCDKKYATQFGLTKHCQISKHDGDDLNRPNTYKYICSVCGKKCWTIFDLEQHCQVSKHDAFGEVGIEKTFTDSFDVGEANCGVVKTENTLNEARDLKSLSKQSKKKRIPKKRKPVLRADQQNQINMPTKATDSQIFKVQTKRDPQSHKQHQIQNVSTNAEDIPLTIFKWKASTKNESSSPSQQTEISKSKSTEWISAESTEEMDIQYYDEAQEHTSSKEKNSVLLDEDITSNSGNDKMIFHTSDKDSLHERLKIPLINDSQEERKHIPDFLNYRIQLKSPGSSDQDKHVQVPGGVSNVGFVSKENQPIILNSPDKDCLHERLMIQTKDNDKDERKCIPDFLNYKIVFHSSNKSRIVTEYLKKNCNE